MTIHLEESERALLAGMLESAHEQKLHELHHVATHDYKDLLKRQVATIESLEKKLALATEPGEHAYPSD